MGTRVYDAGTRNNGLDIFIHDLKNSSKGYAVLVINPTDSTSLIGIPQKAEKYLITADDILSKTVKLNGEALTLSSDGKLPIIKSKKIKAGEIMLPSHCIMFLTFKKK